MPSDPEAALTRNAKHGWDHSRAGLVGVRSPPRREIIQRLFRFGLALGGQRVATDPATRHDRHVPVADTRLKYAIGARYFQARYRTERIEQLPARDHFV